MSKEYARQSEDSVRNYVRVLDQVGGAWHANKLKVEDLLQRNDNPGLSLVFAPSKAFLGSENTILRQKLSGRYGIPIWFWSDLYLLANGFSGREDVYDERGNAKDHNTWFRFLIKKHILGAHPLGNTYEWDEMCFFTTWNPPCRNVVFCFDTPTTLQDQVRATLASIDDNRWAYDPYSLHTVIIEAVLVLYESSVWSLRTMIRDIELNRTPSANPNPDYARLHEIARHTTHASETLDVAVGTVDSMLRQHKGFLEERPVKAKETATVCISKRTAKTLEFQSQMLQNFKLRSQSNGERLRNEITLAFNTVAQHDSRVAVEIGRAAKMDSSAMKTIAILTLVFLPATFVSTIFGMSSFDYSHGAWSTSRKFWIYWLIAVPLTLATGILWFVLQRRYFSKIK